jgi:quercetin dioxygenase-like cupin family protein
MPLNTVVSERPTTGGCIHERDEFALGWRVFESGEAFPAHLHEHFEEIFIVVTGELVVVVERTRHRMHAGDRLAVERGRVHELINDSAQPAEICYLKVPFVADDTIWVEQSNLNTKEK